MTRQKLIDNRIETKVVTTPEQQRDAFMVRAVCYAGKDEGAMPIKVLVDGNDYQATHFVAYVDGEPVGSARVRWFRDFAKFERSCFVPAFRNMRTIYTTSSAVFAHIAAKGYDMVLTVATPKYAALWQKLLGFERSQKPAFRIAVSEEPFFELMKRLTLPDFRLSAETESAIIERIEGRWNAPLAYEV